MALLIKNVQLIEEQGIRSGDILISGDRISAIGNLAGKKDAAIIDGQGAYLAPGFIDIHAESDHYLGLLDNPGQEDLLAQGITTAFVGQDGWSLAPIGSKTLESMNDWYGSQALNTNWRSFGEFASLAEKKNWGVNIGSFVGGQNIAQLVRSSEKNSASQNQRIEKILRDSFKEGAFGFSLNFAESEYFPEFELLTRSAIRVLAEMKGVVSLASTERVFLRTPSLLLGEWQRIARLGAKVILADFSLEHSSSKFSEYLNSNWNDFYFESSPWEGDPATLISFLPAWARKNSRLESWRALNDSWVRERIERDLPSLIPNETWIIQAGSDPVLAGLSLANFMEMYDVRESRPALAELMIRTKLRGVVVTKNKFFDLKKFLANPRTLIGSRGISLGKNRADKTARSVHNLSFPRLLEAAVFDKVLPLDQAVKKISKLPAEIMGLEKIGSLKEGFRADLTMFSTNEREIKIEKVFLSGKLAWEDGALAKERRGVFIKPNKK